MTLNPATDVFFNRMDLDASATQTAVNHALHGLDDGELFLEYRLSESIAFDDGRLKNASSHTTQGFGLRGVLGESTGYAHSNELSQDALLRAAQTVKSVNAGQEGFNQTLPARFGTNQALYTADNPLEQMAFIDKVNVLQAIDAYLRSRDPRVKQVSASLAASWQVVHIMRAGGEQTSDIRPLVRLNISVVVEENGRMESGSSGVGGRTNYAQFLSDHHWHIQAHEALNRALTNLEARPAPAGELPVVLGAGWCGVLLHEAVGHGLEGDFNRKQTSTFSGRIGERVASKGVTVVDNGTIPNLRGSISIDDEGTPPSETVLIEDGILKGYLQDRLNARLMNVSPTGNGRRESYAHTPMPRMTNTYMQNGTHDPAEIIASVKRGIYAPYFGGGQVDITSGKFVFSATEAYMIEDGKISHPIKGATLIGNGPDVMQKITMIGTDTALDGGIGTCGKDGQSVPVGVGQPTLRIDGITVGGTQV